MDGIPFIRLILFFVIAGGLLGIFFPEVAWILFLCAAICGVGFVVKLFFFRG